MSSICENPLCKKVGDKRCKQCKVSCYCGEECAKKMWPFHKIQCKLSLEQLPLPSVAALPLNVPNFQVQLFELLAALDRSLRIVEPDVTVGTGKKKETVRKTGLVKVDSSLLVEDTCPARRFLQLKLSMSSTGAVPGSDLFEQLHKNGMPLQLVVRLSYLNKSLQYCIALAMAAETLAAQRTLILTHIYERLGTYYIVRGHVVSHQPRIDIVDTATQRLPEDNDHFALLLVPIATFQPHEVIPKSAEMERAEVIANQVESAVRVLNAKWKSEIEAHLVIPSTLAKEEEAKKSDSPGKPKSPATTTTTMSESRQNLLRILRDHAIFLAPCACDADALLYAHRLRKGIPEWFYIEELFTASEINRLPIDDDLRKRAIARTNAMYKDLFGANLAEAQKNLAQNANKQASAASQTEKETK